MCTPLTLAIPRFTFSNKLFLLVFNIAIVLELTAQALVFLSQGKLETTDQLITDRYLASTTSGSWSSVLASTESIAIDLYCCFERFNVAW